MKVNLGCGPLQPDGWINVDGSNRAWFASHVSWLDSLLVKLGLIPPTEFGPHIQVCDLTKPLQFADTSVDCFYAGELLEHLRPHEGEALLLECWRCLKPGGVLRVCVPDMLLFWKGYVQELDRELAKPADQRDESSSQRYMDMFFSEICVVRPWLGSMGQYHKWGYDEVNLVALFKRAGFSDARRRAYHDSAVSDIKAVERSDFLIVEGSKEHPNIRVR